MTNKRFSCLPLLLLLALATQGIAMVPVDKLLGWRDEPRAQQLCGGHYILPTYLQQHPVIDQTAPIKITAEGSETLTLDGMSELRDNVVVTQSGEMIHADRAMIFRDSRTQKINKVVLSGMVRIYQRNVLLVAEQGVVTLYPRTVSIEKTVYRYHAGNKSFDAWGQAATGYQDASRVITLHDATYSSCPPNTTPAWKISANKIVLDKANNVGKAYNTVLTLKGVPVFYSPYYSFQLSNERKTGLLAPVYGSNSDSGAYLGLPIYLNLAPNYDLTLTPQYYGDRGVNVNAQFRYLNKTSNGSIKASILPNDTMFETFKQNALITYSNTALYPSDIYQPYLDELRSADDLRGMLMMENHAEFSSHFSTRHYINLVSDPYYLSNITSGSFVNNPLANQLLNLLQVQYGSRVWDMSAYLESYQTLHLITQIQDQGQALDQYSRYPGFDVHAYSALGKYVDLEFNGDYNHFAYSSTIDGNKPTGDRLHVRPRLGIDFESSAAYFKPQLWLDSVAYSVDNTTPETAMTSSRTLPIVDADAGLHFFRQFHWGNQSYQQTVEPHLFYLYVPYQDQNDLPNFDTIQLPFFYDQLFSLNAFEGVDRLQNANQLSLGLTSDILSSNSERRFFHFDLGSIYYFEQPQVCLASGCDLRHSSFSPIIAGLSFSPTTRFTVTTSYAWDPETDATNNAKFTLSYKRDGDHVVNLSYVFVNENNDGLSTFTDNDSATTDYTNNSSHLVGSVAWPITSKWSALAQSDYNLELNRLDSLYAGVQYDTCCWALRFVAQELFDSSTVNADGGLKNSYNTGFFVQINLKGLASFGSSSNSSIRSIISGYKN